MIETGKYSAGALDLGSNMFRLVLGRRRKPGSPLDYQKEVEVCRVAEGLARSGILEEAPLARAEAALRRFRGVAERSGATRLAAVATGAFRQARNRAAATQRLAEALGSPVEVIEGTREAELTLRGIRTALGTRDPITVIDVGGASTEVIIECEGERRTRSFDIGVVTLTERCSSSFLREQAEQTFLGLGAALGAAPCAAFASGGAAVALAAHRAGARYLTYAGGKEHPLSRAELAAIFADFDARDPDERAAALGVSREHGDLVPAGFAILDAALAALGLASVIPTSRGVAEGLLDEMVG